jgi:hypothetical protein
MLVRFFTCALALGAFAFIGCGPSKLNETKTWEMEVGDGKALDLPAVSSKQTLNVEFSSSDGDVAVFVFKEEDAKGEDGILSSASSKALKSAKGKGETFTVDVDPNTPTRVIVRDQMKKTTVKLKVSN